MNDNPCRLLDVKGVLRLSEDETGRLVEKLLEEAGRLKAQGDVGVADEISAHAENLQAFVGKFKALGGKWEVLENEIGGESDDLAPFFQTITRQWKSSHARKAKDGLKVTFPDGSVIDDPVATDTFAKTIERLGPADIDQRSYKFFGLPLVADYSHIPSPDMGCERFLPCGWFVRVPKSTRLKAKVLKELSRLLFARLKVEVVPGKYARAAGKA
jgi:hypothetical protein